MSARRARSRKGRHRDPPQIKGSGYVVRSLVTRRTLILSRSLAAYSLTFLGGDCPRDGWAVRH